ncbi:carboxy methyl transferase for protein phosphatase 2A [Scheffersomyces xylosifermentans]|uniref:carboxy methyl transferase for protein phosphatase 2A n=1 Tax=Scheffersomyces xylosifermentans TaxID=1304137 RepID=UPI00315DAE11
MLSPSEKQDKLIRATDLDALSCRYSSNSLSYFVPPDPFINELVSSYQTYLQYSTGYSSLSAGRVLRSVLNKKLPLINKGTYLRTIAIDLVVEDFIQEFKNCQIISLGGGSDTRCFRVLNKHKSGVVYHEIDFPESVKIKKLAISKSKQLQRIVNCSDNDIVDVASKEQFEKVSPGMHSDRYHLSAYDLRTLSMESDEGRALLATVDANLPTLVLSECVLCYMAPDENELVLKFWKSVIKNLLAFIIYEPMSLNDAFGDTMTRNLQERGINLLTFNHFPNLASRQEFLSGKCGLSNVKLSDMSDIAGYNSMSEAPMKPWIPAEELKRISRLEMIDEVEEIRLLLEHYCLCYGEFCGSLQSVTFKGIDNYRWLIPDVKCSDNGNKST